MHAFRENICIISISYLSDNSFHSKLVKPNTGNLDARAFFKKKWFGKMSTGTEKKRKKKKNITANSRSA